VTIEWTAAMAAELGLLSEDVTLTADVLGQVHDGLSDACTPEMSPETAPRSLYALPSRPRRD